MRTFLSLALATSLLAGCAGINSVSSQVSSFGEWPAGRAPGSYAFDRLPSQQANAAETERLEIAARPALHKAGFQPVAAGQAPDVLVQVGARTAYADYQPWGDPLWWRGGWGYGGGYGHWRSPMWYGPGWGWSGYYAPPRFEREVAILLRDRATGKPLFEARASNDGFAQANDPVLAAMFEAAMFDFPKLGINPRSVVVPLAPAAP
jgi:hypothetical protein